MRQCWEDDSYPVLLWRCPYGAADCSADCVLLGAAAEKYDPELGPTFGMKSYMHKDGTHNIKLLDLGGGKKFRNFWKSNYPEVGVAYS